MTVKLHHDYKMQPGDRLGRPPNQPIIGVTGNGAWTYIWVGNNAPDDMACFATLAGEAQLRRLAHSIIRHLDAKQTEPAT